MRRFSDVIKPKDRVVRVSPKKFQSMAETGYFTNKAVSLDTKSNTLAQRVLDLGSISVKDKDLKFVQTDISTAKALDLDSSFVKTDLGEIKVYSKNQMLLEDIDPYNLPPDKDIILFGKRAQLTAVGRLVPGEGEEGSGKVDSKIFYEEKQKHGVNVTWKTYLKLLPLLPFGLFLVTYLGVVKEYYRVRGFYVALDRENKELLDTVKEIPKNIPKANERLEVLYPS